MGFRIPSLEVPTCRGRLGRGDGRDTVIWDTLAFKPKGVRLTDSGEPRRSKSQRKRESLALQALGDSLVALTSNDLARVPMWPELEVAVADTRGLQRAARRRQIRYIARLLREGDPDAIAEALDTVRRPGRREALRQRRLERLRDELASGDRSPADLRAAVPELDFQQLRHLVAAARRERETGQGARSERRLFRFLRDSGLDAVDVFGGTGHIGTPPARG